MIDYRIVRSNRKTLSLEIKRSGEIIVRSPMHTTLAVIREFVDSHEAWVHKNLQKIKELEKNKQSALNLMVDFLMLKLKKWLRKLKQILKKIKRKKKELKLLTKQNHLLIKLKRI